MCGVVGAAQSVAERRRRTCPALGWRARRVPFPSPPCNTLGEPMAPHRELPDAEGANPWTTVERRVAWENERLRLRDDRVLQPDGQPGTYTFVQIPRAVVGIVPVDGEGYTYLVRQWRYPWKW